jgi:hypothetical protein
MIAFSASLKPHSVKSGAAAIPTSPATRAGFYRVGLQRRPVALNQRERGQQHQPAAHRRPDDDHRPLGLRIDQVEHIAPPVEQRLLGKQTVRKPASGIVEEQARMALGRRPIEQRGRLAARHVGHIARQEDDRRPGAGRVTIGEPRAARPVEIAGRGSVAHSLIPFVSSDVETPMGTI